MKKRVRIEVFTLIFIVVAIAFSVFFATRNDVEVIAPKRQYTIDEINFGEQNDVLDTLNNPPINDSPYKGLLLKSKEYNSEIEIYYWKTNNPEEAKKIWKKIWLIYGDNLGNKGIIEKSTYSFAYLEQFETTFYFWQKDIWIFFVKIDRYLTEEEKEEFLSNIIPEKFRT
ncbi:MAG: hypothetical protein ACOC80_02345 [Petrotogales bacterium]